jgi:Bacterial Ig domain
VGTASAAPYSATLSGLASGSYALTAVATDSAGATTTSATVTIRVNAAPTVALTSPAGGASFTAPASITIAATPSDPDGTIASVTLSEIPSNHPKNYKAQTIPPLDQLQTGVMRLS